MKADTSAKNVITGSNESSGLITNKNPVATKLKKM